MGLWDQEESIEHFGSGATTGVKLGESSFRKDDEDGFIVFFVLFY